MQLYYTKGAIYLYNINYFLVVDFKVYPLINSRPQNELHIADLFLTEQASQRLGKLQGNSQPLRGEYQYLRPSITVDDASPIKVKQKVSPSSKEPSVIALRKPASHSLRSYEYAKHRPAMTVSEYKMKNVVKLLGKARNEVSDKGN